SNHCTSRRTHDVRHSYATAALAAGVNPKIVSERLGHASVAFTLTQYSHVLPGVDQQAALTMADLMLGRGPVSRSVSNGPQDATRASDPKIERPGHRGSGGRI
ncbi:MAG: tyrosine-type recombinase/integrase, partial [Mycobacteriales bacterium]